MQSQELIPPIGIFDSGIGGLGVWREIKKLLPRVQTLYVADQIHVPYGEKSKAQIIGFSVGISEFLIELGCRSIVVACNTASAASLKELRERFGSIITVGMEPAIKPAASITKTGVVGILATPATFMGNMYKMTSQRFAQGINVIEQSCHGLAQAIEKSSQTRDFYELDNLLSKYLSPIIEKNADVLVLACTHYPFARDRIQKFVGEKFTIIDPAPAVAKYLAEQLGQKGQESGDLLPPPLDAFYTTNGADAFFFQFKNLLGNGSIDRSQISELKWSGNTLTRTQV